MAQRLGLIAGDELHEQLLFLCDALSVGQRSRRLDRLDASFGRLEALQPAGVLLAEMIEHAGLGVRLPTARDGMLGLGRHLAREGDGVSLQAVLADDAIDEPDALRLLGRGSDRPTTIIGSAASTPTTRGSRCVPPAPGRMPSLTSGSPSFAEGTATR